MTIFFKHSPRCLVRWVFGVVAALSLSDAALSQQPELPVRAVPYQDGDDAELLLVGLPAQGDLPAFDPAALGYGEEPTNVNADFFNAPPDDDRVTALEKKIKD